MTVREAVDQATRVLSDAGLRAPRQDAELIVASLIGRNRAFLYAHPEAPLTPLQSQIYQDWLARRADHFPLQYLRGVQEFYGRDFQVGPAVLIPRPETELVVDIALRHLLLLSDPAPRLLDIGTGSGCIAVTLLCECPSLQAAATDLSFPALEVAGLNANRLKVGDRLTLVQGDLLSQFDPDSRAFHLIVANPPYVPVGSPEVDPGVQRYEPSEALFAGPTGLEVYRGILAGCAGLLRPGGSLILELGRETAPLLPRLAADLDWRIIEVHPDLAGIQRCAVLRPLN